MQTRAHFPSSLHGVLLPAALPSSLGAGSTCARPARPALPRRRARALRSAGSGGWATPWESAPHRGRAAPRRPTPPGEGTSRESRAEARKSAARPAGDPSGDGLRTAERRRRTREAAGWRHGPRRARWGRGRCSHGASGRPRGPSEQVQIAPGPRRAGARPLGRAASRGGLADPDPASCCAEPEGAAPSGETETETERRRGGEREGSGRWRRLAPGSESRAADPMRFGAHWKAGSRNWCRFPTGTWNTLLPTPILRLCALS